MSTPNADIPLSAAVSPEAAVKFLVGQLVLSGRLQAEKADRVVCQLLNRESLGSTAIGNGFSLPHSKSDVVGEVLGIVGHSALPIPWPGSLDDKPVQLIFLLITPASDPRASLRALEAVVQDIKGS